jgi:hypothetical protein
MKKCSTSLTIKEMKVKTMFRPGTGGSCYNPSSLGGRDQEAQGLKPAQATSSQTLSQTKQNKTKKQKNITHTQKRGWWRGSRCKP